MARPHRNGALPAVNTICSSARMRMISCGRMSDRRVSCLERVRDEPDIWLDRLNWSTSTVVSPQRFEMYSAVSGSLIAEKLIHVSLGS